MTVRQISGVAGALKRNPTHGDRTSIRVIDGEKGVELVLGCCDSFAELSADQAFHLAKCLQESARRIAGKIKL